MELTFNDLKQRDVMNIADGKCLGRITDLTLSFPKGILRGITVPGRKTNFIARFFNKSEIYIYEKNIVKIGGDVILVDLRCRDLGSDNIDVNRNHCHNLPPRSPCDNPCPPPSRCNSEDGEREYGEY